MCVGDEDTHSSVSLRIKLSFMCDSLSIRDLRPHVRCYLEFTLPDGSKLGSGKVGPELRMPLAREGVC